MAPVPDNHLEAIVDRVDAGGTIRATGVKAAISSLSEGGRLVGKGRKRGRPPGVQEQAERHHEGIIIVGGKKRKRGKLSAAARKAISDAQKARWAKQKAGAKPKRPMRMRRTPARTGF